MIETTAADDLFGTNHSLKRYTLCWEHRLQPRLYHNTVPRLEGAGPRKNNVMRTQDYPKEQIEEGCLGTPETGVADASTKAMGDIFGVGDTPAAASAAAANGASARTKLNNASAT